MEANLKKKWVVALRSGKYKQCRRRLYDEKDNSYCCMGVACEVFKTTDKHWKDEHRGNLPSDIQKKLDIDPRGQLPARVIKKLNLPPYASLVWMNDKGRSFNEIADFIEKYF